MSPYGSSKLMTEIMLRDAGAAHGLRHVILRYFNVAGADPQRRTGQSTKGATHLIKVAVRNRARPARRRWRCSAPTTRRPTAPASATISMSPIWCARIRMRSPICARGGASATLNCGYGRGFSVLEVIDTVKRVSGVDFKVELAGRAPGDPAQIVAASDRARVDARTGSRSSTISIPSCAMRWPGRRKLQAADRSGRS